MILEQTMPLLGEVEFPGYKFYRQNGVKDELVKLSINNEHIHQTIEIAVLNFNGTITDDLRTKNAFTGRRRKFPDNRSANTLSTIIQL